MTVEDFKKCSNCFSNLQSRSPKVYFPAIDAPLTAFNGLSQLKSVKTKHLALSEATLKSAVTEVRDALALGETKYFICTFINSNLADNDQLMANFQRELDDNTAIFVYTAESSGRVQSRKARQAGAAPSNATKPTEPAAPAPKPRQEATAGTAINPGGRFLMYYKQITEIRGDTVTDLTLTANAATPLDGGAFNVTLTAGTHTINLKLFHSSGYWMVSGVLYDSVEFAIDDSNRISVVDGFSFACNARLIFHSTAANSDTRLVFNGLQIEPDFKETPTIAAFSEPWNCVGFTSPGILGGLFITIILLGILSIGVTCMMSINTNDRFDDPKGKTIIINTGE